MLTGKRAYPHAELEPLQPQALDRVVKICLAKDPDARWQSAHDVEFGLGWIAEGAAAAPARVPVKSFWRERASWTVATTLLAGLLLLALRSGSSLTSTTNLAHVVRFPVSPPEGTVFSGQIIATVPVPQFALSPDGRALVFAAAAAGFRPTLRLRQIDDLQAHPLPGTEDPDYPFWSFDNRWIAFFSEGKLKRIPAEGGAVTVIADRIPPDPRGDGPDGPSFGIPTPLFQTRVPPGVSSFRTHFVPSRDGRRFLVNTQTDDPSPSSNHGRLELDRRVRELSPAAGMKLKTTDRKSWLIMFTWFRKVRGIGQGLATKRHKVLLPLLCLFVADRCLGRGSVTYTRCFPQSPIFCCAREFERRYYGA